jgi:hypothetical protein
MELTNWRQLSDRGPDLIACLDFPGGRAAAGFADLDAGIPVDACFLHFHQAGPGPLTTAARHWASQLLATGRPIRAVLGYCAGTALATRLADAIATTTRPPLVLLFDAVPITGDSLSGQFITALESNARHLTPAELTDARTLADQLTQDHPADLPRIAAALASRYSTLMGAVATRLSVSDSLRRELTATFTAYLDYLLLASEGGFDMRTATPLFLTSAGYEPPVEGARTIALDTDHDDLLRTPHVHELVTDLLTGEHPW